MDKTNLTYAFQEFTVKNYTLDKFNARFNQTIESWDEIIGPPLLCLLPKTKFYVAFNDEKLTKLPKIPNNIYTIVIHPESIGLKTDAIYLSIKIDFINWCKPTKSVIQFPVLEYNDDLILDPFKTRKIMESRGLPPYILEKRKLKQINKDKICLNLMKKLNLENSKQMQLLQNFSATENSCD
jgi:hypothetical protein